MSKEYRIDIKVRNNLILSRIEKAGFKSAMNFCKQLNIGYNAFCRIVGLKYSALDSEGNFRPIIQKMCDALNCLPEDLFTQDQLTAQLETNKKTILVNEAEMKFLIQNQSQQKSIEEIIGEDNAKNKLHEYMDRILNKRENFILKERFRITCETEGTLLDIAKYMDVTQERIRQIEQKAIKKLKYYGFYSLARNPEIKQIKNILLEESKV